MLKIFVDGNATAGYMVDIHDGDRFGLYNPAASSDMQALMMALDEHFPKPAPAPEPVVTDPEPPAEPVVATDPPKETLLERIEEDLGMKPHVG